MVINTYKQVSNKPANTDVLGELLHIKEMVEESIAGLQPAVVAFSKLYNEQEISKLNIMKVASTIEVNGQKMKTVDFISAFDDVVANSVKKILDTAKNSMRTAFLLNIAVDEIDVIQAILGDASVDKNPKNIAAAIGQLSNDLKKSQNTLKDLVSLDIEESMRVQERLSTLLESFIQRNGKLKEMISNQPSSIQPLEDVVINIIDELKNTQLIKFKLDKLITAVSGETADGE